MRLLDSMSKMRKHRLRPHTALVQFCTDRGRGSKLYLATQLGVSPSRVTALLGGDTPTLRQAVVIRDIAGIPVADWVSCA